MQPMVVYSNQRGVVAWISIGAQAPWPGGLKLIFDLTHRN